MSYTSEESRGIKLVHTGLFILNQFNTNVRQQCLISWLVEDQWYNKEINQLNYLPWYEDKQLLGKELKCMHKTLLNWSRFFIRFQT